VQRAAFARTVALARAVGRPLVVHVREAHAEAAAILAAEGAAAVGGVIHCFTGDRDDARRYLDLGFSVSVAGIVTFKNAEALRDAVRTVPLDRLLVATDAPYLAPVPHRGRRNEGGASTPLAAPKTLIWSFAAAGALLGQPPGLRARAPSPPARGRARPAPGVPSPARPASSPACPRTAARRSWRTPRAPAA